MGVESLANMSRSTALNRAALNAEAENFTLQPCLGCRVMDSITARSIRNAIDSLGMPPIEYTCGAKTCYFGISANAFKAVHQCMKLERGGGRAVSNSIYRGKNLRLWQGTDTDNRSQWHHMAIAMPS